jgi:hypothetical protein
VTQQFWINNDSPIKILFLTAEPNNTAGLRLQQELRDIEESLQLSQQREKFILKSGLSARVKDISQEILNFAPHIVHFSGHGVSTGELCFEDNSGKMQPVKPETLATLFDLVSNQVQCVVLNACYSEIQARAIVEHIPFVIGMNTAIGDQTAITFAVGFYKALWANRSPEEAYKFGKIELELHNIPEELTPILLQKSADYPTDLYYVERDKIENFCFEKIIQPGALIRIKAPNNMGKTLLMNRIVTYARVQNYQTVTLSLSDFINNTTAINMETLLKSFCTAVSTKLGLANRWDEYTDRDSSPMDRASDYLQNYLLVKIAHPLVLALDDMDLVFEQSAIASNFCSLLRTWHLSARKGDANSRIWANLRLVIVHSTENYSALNITTSPLYNVGTPVDLPELNQEQVKNLVNRNGIDWTSDQIKQLMEMLGGQPFLIQTACTYFRLHEISFEKLLNIAPNLNSPFIGHLRKLLNILTQNPVLREDFRKVVNAKKGIRINADSAEALQRLGLVKIEGYFVEPRCKLYREYFKYHLN